MQSHLGGSAGRDPRKVGKMGRNVYATDEVIQHEAGGIDRKAHGRVVDASQVHRQWVGGSRGDLHGPGAKADPRARMHTTVSLDEAARYWEGSSTHFDPKELPENDPWGHGMAGTGRTVMASELDQVDAQHGTHKDYNPLTPGAYQLNNGMILLVADDGRRAVVTLEQFQSIQQKRLAMQQQAQQRGLPHQPPGGGGLLGKMMNRIRRGQ